MRSLVFVNQYGSTPDTGFGGRYFYIAKSLTANCNVTMISVSNHHLLRNSPRFKGLVSDEVCDGVNVRWVKLLPYKSAHSPIRVLNWFLFSALLPILLFKTKYEVIHYSSPSPVGVLGAWASARLKKARLVFDVRDVWPETLTSIGGIKKSHFLIQLLSWIELFAYKRSDHITSNLPNFDVRLSEVSMNDDKFTWVPNGVLLTEASEAYESSKFSFPKNLDGKKIVEYTGTLGEANSLYKLLDAALILREYHDIVFVFIGEGKLQKDLEIYCEDNQLNNVYFLGSLPKQDVYKAQALADILCVGALSSPLYRYGVAANKLYEYMFSNTPVLYYVDTPNYNPVSNANCGIEVPAADGSSLAEAILKLLKCPEIYSSGSGRAYIEKTHSYKLIANRIYSISFPVQQR